MIEKISIKGRDVWVVVEPQHIKRENPNIIPTEYFIVSYNLNEPTQSSGEMFKDSDNRPKRFVSPVEALEYANERLQEMI